MTINMLRSIFAQVVILCCICINAYAQEEESVKKVSDRLQEYFLDSVRMKIMVEIPYEQKLLYREYVKIHKNAIDNAQSIRAKRELTKQFYRNYFVFPYEVDNYNRVSDVRSLKKLYFDDKIYEWFGSNLNKPFHPTNYLKYGCPNYHRIVSMFNLSKHKDYILKNNGMYWLEQPEEYVENRLQFILNEFEQNAEVSKFSKVFLQDLIALSNLEKDGYYKELIIKFFADAFSVIESKNTHKYSNCFKNVFVKDVLSINTDTDLIDKTCYMLNHIMPRSFYGPNRWYTFSFAYFDSIILKNIDFNQPNKRFREVNAIFGKEQLDAWTDELKAGEFTWTDKLIEVLKNDDIGWHFYMKSD